MTNRLIALIMPVLVITACVPPENSYISGRNQSDLEIIVGVLREDYAKDSLAGHWDVHNALRWPHARVRPGETFRLYNTIEKAESWRYTFEEMVKDGLGDRISVFFADAALMDAVSLDLVVENYDILARYDLTEGDLDYLGWSLCYPPDERMSTIHMFPSYEEVAKQ